MGGVTDIVRLRGFFHLYDQTMSSHVEAPVDRAILRNDALAIDLSLDGADCTVQLTPQVGPVAYEGAWQVRSRGRSGTLRLIRFDETTLTSGQAAYVTSGFWLEGHEEQLVIGVLRRVADFATDITDE